MQERKNSFSQRHPLLFGLFLVTAAVVLIAGAMAAVRFWGGAGDGLQLGKGRLGIVHLEGLIENSRAVNDWMKELREDDSVKGVLLRIDSPGGVVGPSQEIYSAVARLAAVKPVVASMGAVAASGGYYAAAPAHKIVANPGTLTGSIGVILELANVQELMEKIGIRRETVTSGELKGAGSPFKPMTPKERAYFEALVADLHAQFVADVASGRKMEPDKVASIADGRALTGRQALELGLVDQLGGFEESMDLLKSMCGMTGKVPVVEGPETKTSLLFDLLTNLLGFAPPGGLSEGPRWLYR
jgi:protease-4